MIESLDRRTSGLLPAVLVGDSKEPLPFGAGFEVLGDDEQHYAALLAGIESSPKIPAEVAPSHKPWNR